MNTNTRASANKQTAASPSGTRSDLPKSIKPWARQGVIPWARRTLPYLKDEFQHLADQFWNFAEDELFSGDIKPAADIAEAANEFVISMDVPGLDPDEIDVQVTENTITIRGDRETCCCNEDEDVFLHRSERRCGKFRRTSAIPGGVTSEARAQCKNGVLTINLPKTKGVDSRTIKVCT